MSGWLKDPRDERDYLHPTVGLAELPERVDLSALVPSVRNQGSMNSCVGFGVGSALGAFARHLGIYQEWYSPQQIWNWGREARGMLNMNVGVYPRDTLDRLVKNGVMMESGWPYSASKLDTDHPDTRKDKAIDYGDLAYYRCVDGVEGICSALAEGHVVAIGSPWFQKWGSLSPAGTLSSVSKTDTTVGGHEYLIYGYDKNEGPGVFYCQNSWGGTWGDNGRFKLYFSAIPVFKELWGYDAFYVTFSKPVDPEPIPEPTPEPEPIPEPESWWIKLLKRILSWLRR